MAASKEVLTIDPFIMFGLADQYQDATMAKQDGKSIRWPQNAITLKIQ